MDAIDAEQSSDQATIITPEMTQQTWNTLIPDIEGHTGYVTSVVFSPNSKQVVSALSDQTVRLWDAATGAPQQTLEGYTDYVTLVAFSPNGKQVVSASSDWTVRL
jgi:WD40 repeat protein